MTITTVECQCECKHNDYGRCGLDLITIDCMGECLGQKPKKEMKCPYCGGMTPINHADISYCGYCGNKIIDNK